MSAAYTKFPCAQLQGTEAQRDTWQFVLGISGSTESRCPFLSWIIPFSPLLGLCLTWHIQGLQCAGSSSRVDMEKNLFA